MGCPPPPDVHGIDAIIPLGLEILSAKVADESVEVACNCDHRVAGCYGGNLEIVAKGCRVSDDSGRVWSVGDLRKLAEDYWDEWHSRGVKNGAGEVPG